MKKTVSAVLVAALAISLLVSCGGNKEDGQKTNTVEKYSFFALDTDCSLTVYEKTEGLAEIAADEVASVNNFFENGKNIYIAEKGETLSLTESRYALLKKGVEIYGFTSGAFDMTIAPVSYLWNIPDSKTPPAAEEISLMLSHVGSDRLELNDEEHSVTFKSFGGIDIGGIAKGYAGNTAVDALKKAGCNAGVLSLGGNVVVWGEKPDGGDFTVAVKSPLNADFASEYLGTIRCRDVSVVTSGTYERFFEYEGERYHHIIDPSTGYPAETDVLSATVVSKDGAYADALATAFVVLGYEKSPAYIEAAIEKGYIEGAVLVNTRCRVSVFGDIDFELTSGDFVKDE